MEGRYTIGRLAREASVPTSTVRYYERLKLLSPGGRSEANYRVYGPAHLERLRFIRAAQAHGFTLHDIATMLAFQDGGTPACREVQTLIEERLENLDHRLEQLHHLRNVLRRSLGVCRKARRPSERCRVIDRLHGSGPGVRRTRTRPGRRGNRQPV